MTAPVPDGYDDMIRRFVLEQHELYRVLAARVRVLAVRLGRGDELADVLRSETHDLLGSSLTREQMASALVSVMCRVAQREDLLGTDTETPPWLQSVTD